MKGPMTFEEFWKEYQGDLPSSLKGETRDEAVAKIAWQAGYQAALDGWVVPRKG